jgi:hypothetical protein
VQRVGSNWVLASAASPLHPAGTGLVHHTADRSLAVAFRGYVLPRLQSYSRSADVLGYWGAGGTAEHNGVFSAALIEGSGQTLTLITDALGVGALYYRKLGDVVVFSTNARYLATAEDRADLLAWRCLLEASWIAGDRSLSEGVRRVPAGRAVRFAGGDERSVAWFDFERLGRGERPVGPHAVGEVEDAFQQAMTRCLRLQADGVALPLSSGYDSRRILAALLRRAVDFEAVTCRVLQKEHRDLDARFAGQMAGAFGFAHTIVEPRDGEQYVADDRARRLLVDAETSEHTWALRVMHALPRRPSLVFDGIAGDILGDPVGWSVLVGLAVQARTPQEELESIPEYAVTGVFDTVLRREHWPEAAAVRESLRDYLRPFGARQNLGELAFLLLRQRRTIGLWSQQVLPPGHVAVCPYLDLDYLRLLLDFRSTDKHATKFQRACLREFWPELYRFPGNRDIPPDLPPGSPALAEERAVRCQAALRAEIEACGGLPWLRELFRLKGRAVLALSRGSEVLALRGAWHLNRVMELVARQLGGRGRWEGGVR